MCLHTRKTPSVLLCVTANNWKILSSKIVAATKSPPSSFPDVSSETRVICNAVRLINAELIDPYRLAYSQQDIAQANTKANQDLPKLKHRQATSISHRGNAKSEQRHASECRETKDKLTTTATAAATATGTCRKPPMPERKPPQRSTSKNVPVPPFLHPENFQQPKHVFPDYINGC